jgi:chitinase
MQHDIHEIKKRFIFVTAHEGFRISKHFNIEPLNFLDLHSTIDPQFPSLKIKGKNYGLVLHDYRDTFTIFTDYLYNNKSPGKENEEYAKIAELWNRNFGEKGSFLEFLNFAFNRIKI